MGGHCWQPAAPGRRLYLLLGCRSCPRTEKEHYRESYIRDTLDLDLDLDPDPGGRGSLGSGGSSQHVPRRLSLGSADSCSSSHTSGVREAGEMAVDEPPGAEALHVEMPPCGSSSIRSGHGSEAGSRGRPEGDGRARGDGECAPAGPWQGHCCGHQGNEYKPSRERLRCA